MKKVFYILATLCLMIPTCYGQTNDFFVGASLSFHNESRSVMIYGPGREERNSVTQFVGIGMRAQKKFSEWWGLNFGVNYVQRQYEMTVPFDHCFFLQPGENCTHILAHVDKYGYKTIELPLGLNSYLIANNRVELYINVTALTAFDFESFYDPFIPSMERIRNTKVNLFSNSLTSSLGFGYNVTKKLKINIEPFVRLTHYQRLDPILIIGYENGRSHLDNFGGHLMLLYRL